MTEYLSYKLQKYEYKLNLNPTNEIYQRKYDYYFEMNGGNVVVTKTVPAAVNMAKIAVPRAVAFAAARGAVPGAAAKAAIGAVKGTASLAASAASVASAASAAAREAFPVAASAVSGAARGAAKQGFTMPTSVIENIFASGARRILNTKTTPQTLELLKGSIRKIFQKLNIKIIKENLHMEKKDFDLIINKIKDRTINISTDFTPEIRFNIITNFIASRLKNIGTLILISMYDNFISLISSTPLDNDDNQNIDSIINKVMINNTDLTKDVKNSLYTIIEYAYILIKKINYHISNYYNNIAATRINNEIIKIIVNEENNIYNAVIDELTKDSKEEKNIRDIDIIIQNKIKKYI
jgi:hypothetical protein